ncbi:sensor histidine kinase [Piscinibacterium candidicorallinum]|uniref:Sensor histidine kinase n=1 Tax=Piscinibacterium candidicorallinum TaxID=1793872 RepID=A0ABV7H1R5_9BURK
MDHAQVQDAGEPIALNRPLPAEVVVSTFGRLFRYRLYPTFSLKWMRGRFIVFSVPIMLFAAALLISHGVATQDWGSAGNAASAMLFAYLFMLFVGPAMATGVRYLRWPQRRESIGVVAAVVFGVALSAVADFYATRYVEGELAKQPEVAAAKLKLKDRTKAEQIGVHVINGAGKLLIFSLLGGGFALISYFRENVKVAAANRRRVLTEAQNARREAELRLSVLQAQVEPHFLFNTFAGLRGLIREDPERAVALLDRLTDYLRTSIPKMRDDGINDSSTVGAQIDSVRAYLELMKVRMDKRLTFDLDVPQELRRADFPPLMVITLVENAIKHGIEGKPEGGHVEVHVEVHAQADDHVLRLTVLDNGIGFEAAQTSGMKKPGTGLGLRNIRTQLATMYGDRARLIMKAPPEGGFAATIELPFVLEDCDV